MTMMINDEGASSKYMSTSAAGMKGSLAIKCYEEKGELKLQKRKRSTRVKIEPRSSVYT